MLQITSFEYNIHQFIESFFSFVDELITIPFIFKFIIPFEIHFKFTILSILSITITFQCFIKKTIFNIHHTSMNQSIDEYHVWLINEIRIVKMIQLFIIIILDLNQTFPLFSCRKIQYMNIFHFYIFINTIHS